MYSGAYGTTLCLSVVASICDVYIAVKRYVINRSADRSIANSYIEIMSIWSGLAAIFNAKLLPAANTHVRQILVS